jgi:hypothetical protein
MGTKSQLGVEMENGEILGCYVHYDGYPDHMIPAIEDYIRRFSTTGLVLLISRAIRTGGIRCFNIEREGYSDKLDEPPYIHRETDFLDDDSPLKIDETAWELHEDLGAQYTYLVDYKTGEING